VAEKLLRDRNLYIDEDDKRDLEEDPAAALQPGRHGLLRMLIDGGVDIRSTDGNNWTMLHHAVWFESIEPIELLIERGADIKAKTRLGNSVLHLAWSGHAVMTMVELGADLEVLNYKNETPLIYACLNEYDDAVDRLFYEGATLTPEDIHQRTALHSACLEGHCGIVHSCLEDDAEVEVYDEDRETPMHLACFSGHADIVKFLLKA
jgi:ankyrin repeat protein